MILDFNDLDQPVVRQRTAEHQPLAHQLLPVGVIEFKSVTMPFINDFILIGCIGQRTRHDFAGVNSQPHRAALVNNIGLLRHQVDNRIGCQRGKLTAMGISNLADVTGIFDHSALHAEAQAEKRHLVFPRILDRPDFTFDTAVAKTTGHQNAIDVSQIFGQIAVTLFNMFGIDPFDLNRRALGNPGVTQRLGHAHVSVRQRDIFANQSDCNCSRWMQDLVDHRPPFGHIFRAGLDIKFFDNDPIQAFFLQN